MRTDMENSTRFYVYDDSGLIKAFESLKNAHGKVSADDGQIAWANDENEFVYIAEKRTSETDGQEQFVYEDDWGEQMQGKRRGILYQASIVNASVKELEGIPDTLSCSDVVSVPNEEALIFCGTLTEPKRLGLVYCYNRKSRLYMLKDKESKDLIACDAIHAEICILRSPRFSTDGKRLAFLAMRDVRTHNACSILCVMDWTSKRVVVVVDIVYQIVQDFTREESLASAFHGIYCAALMRNCWSKCSRYVFFNTQLGARTLWKIADVENARVLTPVYVPINESLTGCESLLDQENGLFLVASESPTRRVQLCLVQMDMESLGETVLYSKPPIVLDKADACSVHVKDWKLLAIPASVSDVRNEMLDLDCSRNRIGQSHSSANYEAFVLFPKTQAPLEGYPILLDVHGGPHSISPANFRMTYDFYAALGFVIVSINYRGSIGFGTCALESLLGKIGTQDIFDCHYGLLYVLEDIGNVDMSRVHCSGGSHGGFICCHLIAQFPEFYRSCILRNPVTNLSSMFFTSDIPDWVLAESGVLQFESIKTAQNQKLEKLTSEERASVLARLWKVSPMAQDLSKIRTPILLGIGANDRRVPPTQGLQFRDSLMALEKEIVTLQYPKDSHPLDSVEAYGDFTIRSGAWLIKHN